MDPLLLFVVMLTCGGLALLSRAGPAGPETTGAKPSPAPRADGVRIEATPVLNREELALFAALRDWADLFEPGWHVCPQVSLDEVLRVRGGVGKDAGRARFAGRGRFCQKRVDFLRWTRAGIPSRRSSITAPGIGPAAPPSGTR